jgi:protein-S-isoprenylcysteine O-methyltransferase Ste14
MTDSPHAPWYRGTRGEWYVVLQVFLFALIALGPRTLPGLPAWPGGSAGIAVSFIGAAMVFVGVTLAVAALLNLGPNLTPLPYPKDGSTLIESGAYGIVRHPIYSGLIAAAFGWALIVHGTLTLAYAALLFVFFDIKSRREEQWLCDKFPEYGAYRARVRKLVPWVY